MKRFYSPKLAILIALLLGFNLSLKAQSVTYNYTGAVQTFTVPLGVYSLALDVQGAAGGQDYAFYGTPGYGGRVVCTLAVTPGQILNIYVGQKGTNSTGSCCSVSTLGGYNGGGNGYNYGGAGGGASDIRIGGNALTDRKVVAGGGGGSASYGCSSSSGGAGGGLSGGNGTYCSSSSSTCYVGMGGSQSAGGAGGTCGGSSGTLGAGGNAYTSGGYAGGGGGGYYGGGGGYYYGGAGGGSSYTDPTLASSVTHTQGYNTSGVGGTVIINPICSTPVAGNIVGTTTMCVGAVNGLSNPTGSPAGAWSSSNTSVATITNTGFVTGVSAGAATITYSINYGTCGSTFTVTPVNINPNPVLSPIGSGAVCTGASASVYSPSIGGGTWSSSNTFQATVGSTGATAVATGVNPGTPNIIYTLPTGCQSTGSVTVNPSPAPMSGTNNVCVGLTTTLSETTSGGAFTSSIPGIATVGSASGVVTGISSGPANITYALSSTGCRTIMPVTVNALPAPFNVTGGGPYCAGSPTWHIYLNSSQSGVNYQLYNGSSMVGGPLAGSGTLLDYGIIAAAGTYTVSAANPTTGCFRNMNGSATVSIYPLPNTYHVTGGGNYCSGGAGMNVGLDGSDADANYDLYLGGAYLTTVPGTGGALDFGVQAAPGVYTVVATNPSTGCINNMTGSVTITVNSLPDVDTVIGGGNYCPAGSGVHVRLNYSQLGINYQLVLDGSNLGSPVAGSNSELDFGLQTLPGNYTAVAVNAATGCTQDMSGSVAVNILPLPIVYNVTGGGSYCLGGSGQHVFLDNSETGAEYQLYNAGAPVGLPFTGTTGSSIDFGSQTLSGGYTVVGTYTSTTCSSDMSGGVAITINPLPTAYTLSSGGSYCQGGTGVDVSLPNSTTGISYQLITGGSPVGSPMMGTGSVLDFGMQMTAGSYTVQATNPATGCQNTMTGAATVGINPLPAVQTVTGGGNYCAGSTGVHIGLDFGSLGINYQLYNGTTPVGSVSGASASLDFGAISTPGTYAVVATNPVTGCTSDMSGIVSVTVSTPPTPYITASTGSSYCEGGTGIDILLANSDPGVNYQLYTGGLMAGTSMAGTGLGLNFGPQTAPGAYTVVATDAVSGCTTNMTGSPSITINPLPASFAITGGGNYCTGGTGINVGLAGSTSGLSYQLFNSGTAVGSPMTGTGSSLNFGPQTAGGTYTIVSTNSSTTCMNNMTGAASITVNPSPSSYALSVASGGVYCAGGTGVNMNLAGSNAGISYQLYNGGTAIGSAVPGTGAALDFGLQSGGGTYHVAAMNNVTGCATNMGSAAITVNPTPAVYTVYGGGNYCAGGSGLHVNLSGSATGVNYQLYNGSLPVGSLLSGGGSMLDFGAQTAAGTYSVKAMDALTGCASNMAAGATVAINPLPVAYGVTGGGNFCSGAAGVHVGVSSSAPGISYQLYNGATAVGSAMSGAGIPIDFGAITLPGTYTIKASNPSTGCNNTMTGSAVVNAITSVTPSVAVSTGGAGSTVCSGAAVTFSAIPVNGGTSPSYAWKVNGVYAGSSSTYTYVPATSDVVTATLTSSEACVTTSTASNSMVVSVIDNVLPTATITGNPGFNVCAGTPVTYTATSTYGGAAPAYEWIKNGVVVGSGTSYTYTPTNGDVVISLLSSNFPCRTRDSVFSNSALMSVDAPTMPSITINATPGTIIKAGTYDTLRAVATNAGVAPTYQWYINGVPVSGANSATFGSSGFGNGDSVSVVVTSSNACGMSSFNSVIIHHSTVGVAQVASAGSSISVMPNPNNGAFTIKGSLGTTADQQVTVEITNMLGQVIYSNKVTARFGNIDEQVKLSNVASGTYLLNLRSGTENTVFHIVVGQ